MLGSWGTGPLLGQTTMAFLRGAGAVDGIDPAANANPNLLASPDGDTATCCICGESHGELINGW